MANYGFLSGGKGGFRFLNDTLTADDPYAPTPATLDISSGIAADTNPVWLGLRRGLHAMPALMAEGAGLATEAIAPSAQLHGQLYDYAAEQRQQAELVPSRGGLANAKNIGDYIDVAGEGVGEMLPAAAGLVGATALAAPAAAAAGASPLLAGIAGGTIAMAPMQFGSAAEAMRQDPAIMNLPATQRAKEAAIYTAKTAPLLGGAPAIAAARLGGAGEVVKNVFKDGFKESVKSAAKHVAGAVPEAAAIMTAPMVASEAQKHTMLGFMNPQRDTSHDNEALKETAIHGMLTGVPFIGATRGANVAWSNARAGGVALRDFISNHVPKSMVKADDATILAWDKANNDRKMKMADTLAESMAWRHEVPAEFRVAAAEYVQRRKNGQADWTDFNQIAKDYERYIRSDETFNVLTQSRKRKDDGLHNAEFTKDDDVMYDSFAEFLDPTSPLAKDEQRSKALYTFIKDAIVNGDDIPYHAVADDFGGTQNLAEALTKMRTQLARAGLMEPDDGFASTIKASLESGKRADLARAEVIRKNLKLEHGDISVHDAYILANRIGLDAERYGSMSANERKAFDTQLNDAFGKNADRVLEALTGKKVEREESYIEDIEDSEGQQNPEFQTIHEVDGERFNYIGSGVEKARRNYDVTSEGGERTKRQELSDRGGLWQLGHGDAKTRSQIRQRLAQVMKDERTKGNDVRLITPLEYGKRNGFTKEDYAELASELGTTVDKLSEHTSRMLEVRELKEKGDGIDFSRQDIESLVKRNVKDLSERVDAGTAKLIKSALDNKNVGERLKTLRDLGYENATSLAYDTQGQAYVKSNLNHTSAGRFSVLFKEHAEEYGRVERRVRELQSDIDRLKAIEKPSAKESAQLIKAYTERKSLREVMHGMLNSVSAHDMIKLIRSRRASSTNPVQKVSPSAKADLYQHFAQGMSSIMNHPEVDRVVTHDRWGNPIDQKAVRGEAGYLQRNEDGSSEFVKATDRATQNAYASTYGRFGGHFRLASENGKPVTLGQANRSQVRGVSKSDPEKYLSELIESVDAMDKLAGSREDAAVRKAFFEAAMDVNKPSKELIGALREHEKSVNDYEGMSDLIDIVEATIEMREAGGKTTKKLESELRRLEDRLNDFDPDVYSERTHDEMRAELDTLLSEQADREELGKNAISTDEINEKNARADAERAGAPLRRNDERARPGWNEDGTPTQPKTPLGASKGDDVAGGRFSQLDGFRVQIPQGMRASDIPSEIRKAVRGLRNIANRVNEDGFFDRASFIAGELVKSAYDTKGVKNAVTRAEEFTYTLLDNRLKQIAEDGKAAAGNAPKQGALRSEYAAIKALRDKFQKPAEETVTERVEDYGDIEHYQKNAEDRAQQRLREMTGAIRDNPRAAVNSFFEAAKTLDDASLTKSELEGLNKSLSKFRSDFEKAHGATPEEWNQKNPVKAEAKPFTPEWIENGRRKIAEIKEKFFSDMQQASKQQDGKGPAWHASTNKAIVDHIEKVLGPQVAVEFVKALRNPSSGKFESGSAQWFRKAGKAIIQIVDNAHDPMGKAYHESMHEFFQRLRDGSPEHAEILERAANSAPILKQMNDFFKGQSEVLEQLKADPHERVAYMYQMWTAKQLSVGPKTETTFQKIAQFFRNVLGIVGNDEHAAKIMQMFHDGKLATDLSPMQKALARKPEVMDKYIDVYKESLKAAHERLADIERSALEGWNKTSANSVIKTARDVGRKAFEEVVTARGQLTGSGNPSMRKLARMLSTKTGESVEHEITLVDKDGNSRTEKTTEGYINAKDRVAREMQDRYMKIFAEADEKVVAEAIEAMQKRIEATSPEAKVVQTKLRRFFDRTYEYAKESGLDINRVTNYMTRSWDSDLISANRKEFIDLLNRDYMDKYGKPFESAEAVADTLITNRGADEVMEHESTSVGYTPYMKALNSRKLDFIKEEDYAKFMNKDPIKIMSQYAHQLAERAEYTKRFGREGAVMNDLMNDSAGHEVGMKDWVAAKEVVKQERADMKKTADALYASSKRHGYPETHPDVVKAYELYEKLNSAVTIEEIGSKLTGEAKEKFADFLKDGLPTFRRSVMAMEGTISKGSNEVWRNVQSYTIAYENYRLLPMSLFSQLGDPVGILVRGGTINDMFKAYKEGLRGVFAGWRGKDLEGRMHDVARSIGIADHHFAASAMGDAYSSLYMSPKAKKWNDRLFRFNGVEGFTQGLRGVATMAAEKSILRDIDKPDSHSTRHLQELYGESIKPEAIKRNADGSLDITDKANRQALYRWADEAVIRPNASMRPSRMSDGNWAIVFHLKQFTYGFHKVIIDRLIHEIDNDNFAPVLAASMYVPIAIAAMTARAYLQNGGEEPAYMKNWDVSDFLMEGLQRSGLMGIPQLGVDSAKYEPTELAGPAVEQISRAGKNFYRSYKTDVRKDEKAAATGKESDVKAAEEYKWYKAGGKRTLYDAMSHTPLRHTLRENGYI